MTGRKGFFLIRWWHRLEQFGFMPIPDSRFYEPLATITNSLVDASDLLQKLLDAPVEKRRELADRLTLLEMECDVTVSQLIILARQSQQPPYDRDSLKDLALRLDDVMDLIEEAGTKFVDYEFPDSDELMRSLCGLITDCCKQLVNAIANLPLRDDMSIYCRAIDKLESRADQICRQAITSRSRKIRSDQTQIEIRLEALTEENILQTNCDGLPLLLAELANIARANREFTRHTYLMTMLIDIYDVMESATDACEHVANHLSGMVMRNG